MKRFILPLVAAALIGAGGAADAQSRSEKARLKGEAALAKEIEGRVAGDPVNCVYLSNIRSSRIIDKTAIVYEGDNGVLYVNRPRGGADFLDDWDVLVTKTYGSQLCSPDSVQLIDRSSRMQSGFVILDKFVPYKRVKTASTN